MSEMEDKADDSAMDEFAMSLEPGTTIAFPNGIVVHRYDTGWEYQDEIEPSQAPTSNGHRQTAEQALRRLLGG